MKKGTETRLYNIIFPIWMLWLIPVSWIVVLPANFVIDLLVFVLTMKYLKLQSVKETVKKVILKVWIFGFVSDFIGTGLMFLPTLLDLNYEFISAVNYNPFGNAAAVIWTGVCVAVSGICIYLFNFHLCLKKALPDQTVRKKLALSMAVFTAPYLFYLPTQLFY